MDECDIPFGIKCLYYLCMQDSEHEPQRKIKSLETPDSEAMQFQRTSARRVPFKGVCTFYNIHDAWMVSGSAVALPM